jgi:hypothetical protein
MTVILLHGNVIIALSRNPGRDKPCPYSVSQITKSLKTYFPMSLSPVAKQLRNPLLNPPHFI